MSHKYYTPTFKATSFNCPNCGAFAKQAWLKGRGELEYSTRNLSQSIPDVNFAFCEHCEKVSIWYKENMIEPNIGGVPLPNQDLSDDIKEDYYEARDILNKSPRGSAALLRLAIQKLCIEFGGEGKNLNKDIGQLVKDELPVMVQQSLDYVRFVGNNAVHPGQLDLKDNKEIAVKLFELINIIADIKITQPKLIENLYSSIPQEQRDAIEKRDNKKTNS